MYIITEWKKTVVAPEIALLEEPTRDKQEKDIQCSILHILHCCGILQLLHCGLPQRTWRPTFQCYAWKTNSMDTNIVTKHSNMDDPAIVQRHSKQETKVYIGDQDWMTHKEEEQTLNRRRWNSNNQHWALIDSATQLHLQVTVFPRNAE